VLRRPVETAGQKQTLGETQIYLLYVKHQLLISIRLFKYLYPYNHRTSKAVYRTLAVYTNNRVGLYQLNGETERCGVTTAEVPGLCDVLGPTGAVR